MELKIIRKNIVEILKKSIRYTVDEVWAKINTWDDYENNINELYFIQNVTGKCDSNNTGYSTDKKFIKVLGKPIVNEIATLSVLYRSVEAQSFNVYNTDTGHNSIDSFKDQIISQSEKVYDMLIKNSESE